MLQEWNVKDSFLCKKEGSLHQHQLEGDKPGEQSKDTCSFCGNTDFRQNDRGQHEKVCLSCGTVIEGMPYDFNEKRAFDADQVRNRKTHDITSNLFYNKNLGSVIGVSKKYYGNYNVFRLVNAERKLAMTLQQRELKEVIRILSLLTDANKLGISTNDVEDLVISYRKKFLGMGLAVGRLRQMVITAFVFLELRLKDRYKHLTYDQYKQMISIPESMERSLKKAISYMVKEHGYKLCQSSLEDSIESVMLSLDIEPIYINKAKDLSKKVKKIYTYNSRKNSGIVAAIIYLVLKQTDKYKKITQEEVTGKVNGVKSIITVRKRISEIRSYIGIGNEKSKRSSSKTKNTTSELDEMASNEEIVVLNEKIMTISGESGIQLQLQFLKSRGKISDDDRKTLDSIISIIPTKYVMLRWKNSLDASKTWFDMRESIDAIPRFKNKKIKESFDNFFKGSFGSVTRKDFSDIEKAVDSSSKT